MISALFNGQDFGEMSYVHGIKKLVKCICETNNKMIEFLHEIYKSLQSKNESQINKQIVECLSDALNNAIGDVNTDEGVITNLINTLAKYIEK